MKDVTKSKILHDLKVTSLSVHNDGGNNDNNVSDIVETKLLEKKKEESLQHVLTKAILWSLFKDDYHNHRQHSSSSSSINSSSSSSSSNTEQGIRMEIEYDIGDPNYIPDVIGFIENDNNVTDDDINDTTTTTTTAADTDTTDSNNTNTKLLFWGESGRMKVHKSVDLMVRYPDTDIVHCRWGMKHISQISDPLEDYLQQQQQLEYEQQQQQKEIDDDDEEKDDDGITNLLLLPILRERKGKFLFCSLGPTSDVWRYFSDEKENDDHIIRISKNDLEWKTLIIPPALNINHHSNSTTPHHTSHSSHNSTNTWMKGNEQKNKKRTEGENYEGFNS